MRISKIRRITSVASCLTNSAKRNRMLLKAHYKSNSQLSKGGGYDRQAFVITPFIAILERKTDAYV